ncbi:hypothetical protein ACQ4M3_32085 [Leptolyngbya sp. AN03gr2]
MGSGAWVERSTNDDRTFKNRAIAVCRSHFRNGDAVIDAVQELGDR